MSENSLSIIGPKGPAPTFALYVVCKSTCPSTSPIFSVLVPPPFPNEA